MTIETMEYRVDEKTHKAYLDGAQTMLDCVVMTIEAAKFPDDITDARWDACSELFRRILDAVTAIKPEDTLPANERK